MFIQIVTDHLLIMNKFKHILLIVFFIPGILFGQKINISELKIYNKIANGDYNVPIDSIDLLITENPEKYLLLAKADVFMEQEKYSDALKIVNNLNRIYKGIASRYEIEIYLRKNDFIGAKQALINNLNTKNKISLYELLNNPEFDKLAGTDEFNEILGSNLYSNIEKQLYQAEKMMYAEKYDQALFIADEILSRDINIAQAYYLKSVIRKKQGDNYRALQLINIAIDLNTQKVDYYKQRLDLLISSELFEQALIDAGKIVRMQPDVFENYVIKSGLLVQNREFKRAEQLSSQLLSIDENNVSLLYVHAKSLHKLGENVEALKSVNSLLEKTPTKETYELRGDIYMETATYKYAEKDYSMYLDIEPFNGEIYFKKGLARYNSGDNNGACSDWEKAKRYGSYKAVQYIDKYCD